MPWPKLCTASRILQSTFPRDRRCVTLRFANNIWARSRYMPTIQTTIQTGSAVCSRAIAEDQRLSTQKRQTDRKMVEREKRRKLGHSPGFFAGGGRFWVCVWVWWCGARVFSSAKKQVECCRKDDAARMEALHKQGTAPVLRADLRKSIRGTFLQFAIPNSKRGSRCLRCLST